MFYSPWWRQSQGGYGSGTICPKRLFLKITDTKNLKEPLLKHFIYGVTHQKNDLILTLYGIGPACHSFILSVVRFSAGRLVSKITLQMFTKVAVVLVTKNILTCSWFFRCILVVRQCCSANNYVNYRPWLAQLRNRAGPKTVPRGTPNMVGDLEPFNTEHWRRWMRKLSIHLKIFKNYPTLWKSLR